MPHEFQLPSPAAMFEPSTYSDEKAPEFRTYRIQIAKTGRVLRLGFSGVLEGFSHGDDDNDAAEFASYEMAHHVSLVLWARRAEKAKAMGMEPFGELEVVERRWPDDNPMGRFVALNRMDRASVEFGRFFSPCLPAWMRARGLKEAQVAS